MATPDGYVANLTSRDVLLRLLDVALLDQRLIVLSQPISLPTPAEERGSARRPTLGDGNARYDERYLRAPSAEEKDPQLSRREREILTRLAEGASNKKIAQLCNIAQSTVKVHLKAILRKIAAQNRTQAALWAIAKGYHRISESTDTMPNGIGDRTPAVQRPNQGGNGNPVEINTSRNIARTKGTA